ncbi:hypothetical protein NZX34_003054 [Vibrio parahaemolyticus]|uniref:hypothetical protein n=1 Tax=Vibrio parahaemolyticus TaxID=670 RepID=UPI00084B0D9A|nr:hypothetical protein [Vibrio parahaemolyticus]EGQ9827328.1 hypothetical protein [Vibrio parahaemolyticus]EHH1255705.1 hypothetical protein [Vibrio parahaemolyticus]EHR6657557.1 hypothetical protein [Vibrio parahaemolyticus]EJG2056290.1 hypothetical protein [Vibrio parahaemolyticus]EJQ9763465.1 hypothetical protein [Vibrio parahaemolyticus]
MLDVSKNVDAFISKNREKFREKAIEANVENVFLWELDSWTYGKSGYAWLKGANKGKLAFTHISRIKGVEKMDVAPIYQNFMRAMLVETLIMSGNSTPAGAVFQQEILVMKRWYAELVKATGQSHPMYLTSDIIHAAMDTHAECGAASTAVSDYADKAVALAKVLSAKSLTLTTLNVQNQHPTRNTSVDVTDLDPLKTEDEHLISIKAFMSIIELIYLAENDEDKVLLMGLLLLLITGLRFQELQNLKIDCLVRREITDPDKLQYAKDMGFPDYYLGIDYIGAKKAGKRIHWLAPSTYPVIEMIFERVKELTNKQRALLIYYRESDFTYFLPDAIRELPEDEVESRELVGHVVAGTGGARNAIVRSIQTSFKTYAGHEPTRIHEVHKQLKHYFYTKTQVNDYIVAVYSSLYNFEQEHRGVHTYNDNGTLLNFNYEELLFISPYGMGNLVNDFRHLSVITPLQENTLKKWLGNTQGSTSIFSLFGLTEDDGSEIKIPKHTPRHNINTFLAIAGITDHLQAILMGRVDVTQNKHYQHGVESLEYRAAAMAMVALEKTFHAKKDVFTEDDQMSLFDTPVEHSPVVQGSDKSEVTQRMAAYAKANRTRTGVESVKSTASMIVSKDLSTEANLKRAMQTYGASSEEMAKYVGDSMSESFMPELKEAHDKLINNKQEQEAKRLLERHARIYPLVFGACTRDVARFGCPFAMRCQEGLPCGYFTLSGRMGETEEVSSRLERKQKEVETLRELVSTNPAFQLALDEQEQSLLLYEALKNKALKSLQESEIVSLLSDDPQNPFAHLLKTIREQDLVGKTPKTLADLFYIEQKRMERDAVKEVEDKRSEKQ